MTGAGIPPKPDNERQRRNAPKFPLVQLEENTERLGPALPHSREWCEDTQYWWETWRCSPQAKLMTDTDWEAMLGAALIHERIWGPNGHKLSSNQLAVAVGRLSAIVADFGATYGDRLRLRLEVQPPQSEADKEQMIRKQAEETVNYVEMLTKKASEIQGK